MTKEKIKINTVEDYIEQFAPAIQEKLQMIRATVRAAAPDASEKISWSMPTFVQNCNPIHFAAHKNHIGLYPGPDTIEVFKDRLAVYRYSKGAIQFPNESPLPLDLIQEIVRYQLVGKIK